MSGGYDEGYSKCPCFWGRAPGSLVTRFLSEVGTAAAGFDVLDLGCGEGKNAYALASAGADVVAVDCSRSALENAKRQFEHPQIQWILTDAQAYLQDTSQFHVVIMYGLLHCLPTTDTIKDVVDGVLRRTRPGGRHIVVAFNDGPHDLSAHPGFHPTLAPHNFYQYLYAGHNILSDSNAILYETHPHNHIPHFHSLTRLAVEISR